LEYIGNSLADYRELRFVDPRQHLGIEAQRASLRID
jgi:hypothetical protein